MAETLGSLCDKLTITRLKQYHSKDKKKLLSLRNQQNQLITEIEEYIAGAVNGSIPFDKLTFQSNKIYKSRGYETRVFKGSIGKVFSDLAEINCSLWHVVEKEYEFENISVLEKNKVIKQLAILNLERTKCVDKIDATFAKLIRHKDVKINP